MVTAAAWHTQSETARILVPEKGVDFLLTVKGNQKQIATNVRQLQPGLPRAFSPSPATAEPVGFPGGAQAGRLTRCIDSYRRGAARRRPALLGH